jgi:BirA family transcriptional regulator, biotin operon repressor / biotin---[acetyl-CoA-carboxylase] ligase
VDPFTAYLQDLERARPTGAGGTGPENLIPENIVMMRSVSSTNRLARDVVAEYEREAEQVLPTLLLAYEQTGGRGRQGRTWSSPAGKGIYATRLLAVDDLETLPSLPLLAGVGLCRGISQHLPGSCRLKWPNDLVVETRDGRRKIGGILIEALIRPGEPAGTSAAAILGFGINHGQEAGEMPDSGTSLRLLAAGHVSLAQFTWDVVAALERELRHAGDVAYAVAAYREHSVHRPGDPILARVGDRVVEGTFAGFDERGNLLLDQDGEELRLNAGEVIE